MAIEFTATAEELQEFEEFIDSQKDRKGALMPVLQYAQSHFGHIPERIANIISMKLGIPTAEIYGVVTFYSQFTLIPKGANEISVCLGTACYVKGAQVILDEFIKELGINVGETTEDGKFSIVETRCVGQCGEAPVVTINDKVYPHFTPEKVAETIDEYR